MPKTENIESSVRSIELFDTGIAFVSGMIIIPSVFVFSGGNRDILSSGPSLMFITLPKVFSSMRAGQLLGFVFFLLVLFAALTSSISLMETVVSIIQDKFHIKRKPACLLVMAFAMVMGIPSSLGFGVLSWLAPLGLSILDFFDFLTNSVLMPLVALFTCIFVGYVVKPKAIAEEVKHSAPFKSEKLYTLLIKYVAPILILLILISSVANTFGWISL